MSRAVNCAATGPGWGLPNREMIHDERASRGRAVPTVHKADTEPQGPGSGHRASAYFPEPPTPSSGPAGHEPVRNVGSVGHWVQAIPRTAGSAVLLREVTA